MDMNKYCKLLSEWNYYTKNGGDCPIKHGLQSRLPERSPYVPSRIRQNKYWQSVCKPKDMKSRIDRYFAELVGNDYISHEAEAGYIAVEHSFMQCFDKGVKPLSFRSAFSRVPQDTSPGYPLNRMGYTEKRQCFGLLKRMNDMKIAFRHGSKVDTFPCLAGVRNQLCKVGENKPRLTWVYPFEVTWLESIFALPLFEVLKKSDKLGWSVKWHDQGVPKLYKKLSGHGAMFGTDISGLDASVLEIHIRRSFQILERRIAFGHKWQRNAWKFIVDYSINAWIVMYNEGYQPCRGVKSGSFFTQIIDSIVVLAATASSCRSLVKERGQRVDEFYCLDEVFKLLNVLGDDSLVKLKIHLYHDDINYIANFQREHFNLTIHKEKGFFLPVGFDDEEGAPPEYLGYTLTSALEIDIDMSRLIAQITLPESPDRAPEDTAIRLIGLAYSHGTCPKRHSLLESCYRHIQRRYGIDSTKFQWKKSPTRSYLRYVLGMTTLPTELPSIADMYMRFVGASSMWLQV